MTVDKALRECILNILALGVDPDAKIMSGFFTENCMVLAEGAAHL